MSKTWIIIRDPGCVPVRKGPFPDSYLRCALRDVLNARMGSFVTVATVNGDNIDVQDGPEALEMMDGRSRGLARRHRASTAAQRS